jgi:hypothetical protein
MFELRRVGKAAGVGRKDGHDADEERAGERGERTEDQRREWRDLVTGT